MTVFTTYPEYYGGFSSQNVLSIVSKGRFTDDLIIGCDYLTSLGTSIIFRDVEFTESVDLTTCTAELGFERKVLQSDGTYLTYSLTVEGTAEEADEDGYADFEFEITGEDSVNLVEGDYDWIVVLVTSDDNRITKVRPGTNRKARWTRDVSS